MVSYRAHLQIITINIAVELVHSEKKAEYSKNIISKISCGTRQIFYPGLYNGLFFGGGEGNIETQIWPRKADSMR